MTFYWTPGAEGLRKQTDIIAEVIRTLSFEIKMIFSQNLVSKAERTSTNI